VKSQSSDLKKYKSSSSYKVVPENPYAKAKSTSGKVSLQGESTASKSFDMRSSPGKKKEESDVEGDDDDDENEGDDDDDDDEEEEDGKDDDADEEEEEEEDDDEEEAVVLQNGKSRRKSSVDRSWRQGASGLV